MTTHKEFMASLPKKRRTAIHARAAEILDAQKRKLKDRMDLADIRAALAEAKKRGTKPLTALKKELDL